MRVIERAEKYKLPAMYEWREQVEMGGLSAVNRGACERAPLSQDHRQEEQVSHALPLGLIYHRGSHILVFFPVAQGLRASPNAAAPEVRPAHQDGA
jgi:hypothetical protein